MQAIKQGQSAIVEMRQMHETSVADQAVARMAELTKANAALLAEIQRASVERDTLAASVLQSAVQPPDTPCTEASFEEDVAPGGGEVVQPGGDNSLSRMTGYVVAAVMSILVIVALAGSISCVAVAVSMSKAVVRTSAAVFHVGGVRNITSGDSGDDVSLPRLSDVRRWMHTDPALSFFVILISFITACYVHSAAIGNFWRVRNAFRAVATQASRHVCIIVAFIFIGFVLSRADAISDSEVVQFQKFVASHQDQPVVMKYFRVASQLSANWTNTVILPDYYMTYSSTPRAATTNARGRFLTLGLFDMWSMTLVALYQGQFDRATFQ
jgi:hypothetical protein